VEEVDENLRRICGRLEEEAKQHPDPEAGEEGLDEAWRVFARRLSAMETKDDRAARRTTRRIVEANLERLREYGSFTRDARQEAIRYQPTWRYQVLVKELGASAAFERVQKALMREHERRGS